MKIKLDPEMKLYIGLGILILLFIVFMPDIHNFIMSFF